MECFKVYLDFSDASSIIASMIDSKENGHRILETVSTISRISKNAQVIFYYDSREIKRIVDETDALDGHYFGGFANNLQLLLGHTSIDICSEKAINDQLFCIRWDRLTYSLDFELTAVMKLIAQKGDQRSCVLSFGAKEITESSDLYFLVDAKGDVNYPVFVSYTYHNTLDSISSWIHVLSTPEFVLNDKDRFRPTHFFWKRSRQRIYQQLSDDSYWYLDFFHKENNFHFEVFDKNGNHLGEADELGHLDIQKQDRTKKAHFLK